MKNLIVVALLFAVINSAYGDIDYAWCQFQGTSSNPNLTGYAYFIPSISSLRMYVSVNGIYQNTGNYHGIHIHEFGDLSDKTSGLSVGSHWNPENVGHGCPDEGSSTTWHTGDTGNWWVASDGTINAYKDLDDPVLSGLDSIIGRAVVIHNRTDDCSSTTSAQARLGFCVIGIGNPSLYSGGSFVNSASSGASTIPIAICDLQPIGSSGVTGRVWFTPTTDGTKVDAVVYNLTGTHGIHIHEYGDLRLTDTGNSTGGHYNPFNASHGIPPYEERHLGDLGNIYHSLNSTALAYSYTVLRDDGDAPGLNLTGLYNVIGRAVVIHSSPDNCSQPTGGAGSRLAYCVIGIGNSSTISGLTGYSSVPTDQDDSLCKEDSGAEQLFATASLVFWAFMAVLF